MTETPQVETVSINSNEEPICVLNSDCNHVGANKKVTDLYQMERSELLGTNSKELAVEVTMKAGQNFQKVLNGETMTVNYKLYRGDGKVIELITQLEPLELYGDKYVQATHKDWELIENTENIPGVESPPSDDFDDLDPEELQEMAHNIRVSSPEGEINLDALMLDIARSHNELEQSKQGALEMVHAIDNRLKEERERNPESEEVKILEEIRHSAFGLYLRVQRGDEELHGKRDGEYSGYFN